MRSELVRQRLKDVLRVDSINSSKGDFLATHVPFKKMHVIHGHGTLQTVQEISEEAVFQTYFDNDSAREQHQLMIVEGSSGAGKSHFIRWIHARLTNLSLPDEVILLIRRSDNTLKGTIKQLLEMEEVQHIQNKEIYERLVKANQTISEQKLKYQIYHQFLVEIQSDEEDEFLNRSRRNQLYALLSNSFFEEHMMASGGAIERIFNKVTSSESGTNQDTVALFEPEDFVLTTDFVDEMENAGADKKAKKLADKLIHNEDDNDEMAQLVSDYMNHHVEAVIQSCAGIEPGDFQQIFKEIRQELHRQGKRLTLLIEDITSFTGINQALLSALITEHTGMNEADQICRLVSVVGTTSEYYKQFRDNYKDRITTQITIQDASLGEAEVIQLVAKYLNVMSLETDTIEEWMKNGAREEDYPVHQVTEGQHWDSIPYKKKKLNLYPFTRDAIRNLYGRMGTSKTPRYILRDIVEPAVNDILSNQKAFPKFCRNIRTGLAEYVDSRIHNLVNQLPIPEEQKSDYCSRVLYMIGIWGNGTLDSTDNQLAGLHLEIFQELGLQAFVNIAYGKTMASPAVQPTAKSISVLEEMPDEVSVSEPIIAEDPELAKRKKAYDEFYGLASKWHYDNGLFVDKLVPIRDLISEFALSTIDWQQEGVSIRTITYVKGSSKNLVGFVNQNRGKEQMLVKLENTEDNFQVLLAFGKWLHLGKKSWNFEDAGTAIYHTTVWLMKYRQQIVQAVQGKDKIPFYLKCAMMTELYRKILNGEYTYLTLNKLDKEIWLSTPKPRKSSGHSESWCKLLEGIYSNREQMDDVQNLTIQYFNLIQGTKENSSKLILKYSEFQEALRQLRSSGLVLTGAELEQQDDIPNREVIISNLKKLFPKLDVVAKTEQAEAKTIARELLDYFGYDEDDEVETEDVRAMLADIQDFYRDANQYGVNLRFPFQEIEQLQSRTKAVTEAIAAMQKDVSGYSTLEILLNYTSDPIGTVKPFLELLRRVDQDVTRTSSQKEQEKEQLTRKGGWADHTDPRFAQEQNAFDEMLKKFKEVIG